MLYVVGLPPAGTAQSLSGSLLSFLYSSSHLQITVLWLEKRDGGMLFSLDHSLIYWSEKQCFLSNYITKTLFRWHKETFKGLHIHKITKKSAVFTELNTDMVVCKMWPLLDRLFLSHNKLDCFQENPIDFIFLIGDIYIWFNRRWVLPAGVVWTHVFCMVLARLMLLY